MLQNCVHDEICKERGKHGSNVFLKHGKTSNSESESLGKLGNAFCAFLDIHKINILKNSVCNFEINANFHTEMCAFCNFQDFAQKLVAKFPCFLKM